MKGNILSYDGVGDVRVENAPDNVKHGSSQRLD